LGREGGLTYNKEETKCKNNEVKEQRKNKVGTVGSRVHDRINLLQFGLIIDQLEPIGSNQEK
jgi:hypothetical protein